MFMNPDKQGVERASLYDLVWSEPMGSVAARFGVSDVGLRKICDKAGIPLPRAGHWMNVRYGKKSARRPALPPSPTGSDQIAITRSGIRASDLDAELPNDIASQVAALRADDAPLPMPHRV